jgi:hypothetical protein
LPHTGAHGSIRSFGCQERRFLDSYLFIHKQKYFNKIRQL